MKPDGTFEMRTFPQSAASAGSLTEPYHNDIPYTQWQWFGRYNLNLNTFANVAISTVAKMFFTQDHDGNGVGTNFVCSAATIGSNDVWTAGHCVNNGLIDANFPSQVFGGWSYNILICPSYDNGAPLPASGCWANDGTGTVSLTGWSQGAANTASLNFDYDFGAVTNLNSGTVNAVPIGNYTGTLGLAWNWGNVHWFGFGYPAAAPFNGNKIEACASSLGYSDSGGPTTPDSVAMGCDMTGGSSGGPWILGFGRYGGQPGGNADLWINGHNDWRHTAEVNEMNSPYYDCDRVTVLYDFLNGTNYNDTC